MWVVRDRLSLKAVAFAMPEVLSRCGASVELAVLLKDTQFTNKPWIDEEWPDGDWEALVCNAKQVCKVYCKSVLKRSRSLKGWSIGRLHERAQRSLSSLSKK